MTFCIGYVNIWNTSNERPIPYSPRVLAAIDNQAARRGAKNARRDAEKARYEKREKIAIVLAKIGMAATAAALFFGAFGDKLEVETASEKVTIYDTDPNSVTKQVCDSQKSLEEELGLPTEGSTSDKNNFWYGCIGTANSVIGKVERGSEVIVTVAKDVGGEVAIANIPDNKDS